jgi:hypothetical protein
MARERRPRRRKWPTVNEQLNDARVTRGTALERLIRDNQDFDLLHPDEADDGLPIPLWLRVQWRKQHPEDVPPADSPAAPYPYPDVLDSIYEWMQLHQDLPRWSLGEQEGSEPPDEPSGGRPSGGGGA